jgi:hypothetical protein
MPLFYVNQYFTYKDCFEVLAETPEEANALVDTWYQGTMAGMPEPDILDPDVAPVVAFTDKGVYVDTDGYTVCDANGDEVLYD